MTEEDYKAVIAKYQQRCFELLNQNIVLEVQTEQLNQTVFILKEEIQKISQKPKRTTTKEDDF